MKSASNNSCSDRQKDLVDKIYSVHEKLRREYRKVSEGQGDEEDWKEVWGIHKQNLEELKEYSVAMHELATQVWDPRNTLQDVGDIGTEGMIVPSSKLNCRIEWVYFKCREYFLGELSTGEKLKLLDVGSCYCPFEKYPSTFDITAVDLCPAPGFEQKVFQCDFLDVPVSEFQLSDDRRQIVSLPGDFFDLVVFSFFLEYLPDRRQRWESCRKAVSVLRTGGVLFVIRPDSSMTEGNIRLMKQMKVGLALLGMKRVGCEKLTHMWCSAYVKLGEDEAEEFKLSGRFRNDLGKVKFLKEYELFAIPQDFKSMRVHDDLGKGEAEREIFDPILLEGMPLSG